MRWLLVLSCLVSSVNQARRLLVHHAETEGWNCQKCQLQEIPARWIESRDTEAANVEAVERDCGEDGGRDGEGNDGGS
jgi:NMD protein affecting ribosome stability and mRNA decay